MSIGSNFNFSGVVSGLDTDAIIAKLISVAQTPIKRIQSQQFSLKSQMDVMSQLQTQIAALQGSIGALTSVTAFSGVSASSSDTAVASVTTSATSLPGVYSLDISQLAQAHKISSAAKTDSTTALGLSGRFLVNEKVIDVSASDTLASIAGKINAANSGVVASILNGGTSNTYLTLTASATGKDNEVRLSELGADNVLGSLGLVGGADVIRKPVTNGAVSTAFRDANTSIATMLGLAGTPPSGTVQINGQNVAIDFATDTLNTIATKIQAADPTVTATVTSSTVGGTTTYALQIVGTGATPSFTDSGNLLKNLGVLKQTPQHELLAAKDALFTLDGVAQTNASNVITDLVPGSTITLLKGTPTTHGTTTITLSRDTTAIKNNVNNFVTALNGVIDFIDQNSKLDKETFATGLLFGDTIAGSIRSNLLNKAADIVSGLSTTLNALADAGITLTTGNKFTVDDAKLSAALTNDLNGLQRLFQATGVTDNSSVKYISATSKTKPSGDAGYAVVVTQLATKASVTGGGAQTDPLDTAETLTFRANSLGTDGYSLTLTAGMTIDDVISRINSDTKLKSMMVASKDASNHLQLTSLQYGSGGDFTVVSDIDGDGPTTGIGKEVLTASGLDIAGTINGEEADGKGQFLTGRTGGATTEGLQIQVTGDTIGSYGSVVFSRGIAAGLSDYLTSISDSVSGDIPSRNKSLQAQIDEMDDRIAALNDRVAAQEALLRTRFAAMESAMAQLQGQSARLNALGFIGMNQR